MHHKTSSTEPSLHDVHHYQTIYYLITKTFGHFLNDTLLGLVILRVHKDMSLFHHTEQNHLTYSFIFAHN